ncbi:MAG: PASTA domain-containing protein [Bacteroidales bacterium]|jgi:beta-lactam-binding protein with PASTA domain|nr:PASTA domain-containing protein [Bacteroidales bacterium]
MSKILSFLKKLYNHYFVKQLLIFFIICFFLYTGTLVILRFYTHHGEATAVPDVRGLTVQEAEILLKSNKMRGKLSDSVYVATAKAGAIISQNPEAGFKVKENRNVFLVINAMTPEMVQAPNVVGVSLRQAANILEAHGLTVGKLSYMPDIARNIVLRQTYKNQNLRKGTKIIKGSGVDLVLGRGANDEITSVPDLAGLDVAQARSILTKYFLNIGVIHYDHSVVAAADTLRAFVRQQQPAAGSNLQAGVNVDVWLTVEDNKKEE